MFFFCDLRQEIAPSRPESGSVAPSAYQVPLGQKSAAEK